MISPNRHGATYGVGAHRDKREAVATCKHSVNHLQIALETTGEEDEDGNQGFQFHIAYHGKASFLADGIAQAMQRDQFLRSVVLTAASKFLTNK